MILNDQVVCPAQGFGLPSRQLAQHCRPLRVLLLCADMWGDKQCPGGCHNGWLMSSFTGCVDQRMALARLDWLVTGSWVVAHNQSKVRGTEMGQPGWGC